MNESVIVSPNENGVVTITLNEPQSANALSKRMLYALHDAIYTMKNDNAIRCVIVTGQGEKAFCAGAHLKERIGMNETDVRKTVSLTRNNVNDLECLPQPVIAAVNGAAFGGGMEIALACDIRIAAEHAEFGLTETSLGIIPGAGGTQRLPRLVGKGRAKEMIFAAKRITAEEALKIGLVEHVAPSSDLLNEARKLADRIAGNAPIAVKQAKRAIDLGCGADFATGLAIEEQAYDSIIPTEDRLEGLQAFKEKRQPRYRGE